MHFIVFMGVCAEHEQRNGIASSEQARAGLSLAVVDIVFAVARIEARLSRLALASGAACTTRAAGAAVPESRGVTP